LEEVSKLEKCLVMYSSLQIIKRLYNNYFGKVFWPVLLLCGVMAAGIPFAICVSKWEVVSHDPRFLLMVFAFSIGWVVIFIGTNAGSTIYQRSMRLLGVIRQVFGSRLAPCNNLNLAPS